MTNVRVGADLFARMGEAKAAVPAKLIVATVTKLREESTRVGLDYKRPEKVRDHRARTCRVTKGYRMVLCDAGVSSTGEHVIVAIDVLEHDEAYAWCQRNTFSANPVTGAFDITDVDRVSAVGGVLGTVADAQPQRPPLFEGVRDRELVRLGVVPDLVPTLRLLNEESQLTGLAALLPPAVRDALIGLASGLSVADVWQDVQLTHAAPGHLPAFAPEPVEEEADEAEPEPEVSEREVTEPGVREAEVHDAEISEPAGIGAAAEQADDLGVIVVGSAAGVDPLADAALSPASSGYLHTFTDDADLLAALEAPLARWRVFLHPRQQAAARHRRYAGPARVTGGPGTGKSIVAIHRVAHLLGRTADTDRILLTTYTTSLRSALERNLAELVGAEPASRVEVRTIDSVPNSVAAELDVTLPRVVYPTVSDAIWTEAAARCGGAVSAEFLAAEYNEVVEPQQVGTLEEYLVVERRGRGSALPAATRRSIWPAIEHYREELRRRRLVTWQGRAAATAAILAERGPLYRHVVVDEAQDLGPAHWRLLRALVAPGNDDLFIAGDGHQRIYARGTSLSRLGIETRGRSTRLSINYRSTEQILRWSAGIMIDQAVEDLDEGNADLAAYRSMLHGERPRTVACDSTEEEGQVLVSGVRTWLSDGVAPHEIAVAGRTRTEVRRAVKALSEAGIPALPLERDESEVDGRVVVSTMHRLKGLEYRCVHVFGVNAKKMPLASSINSATGADRRVDEVLLQERSLLYVACTRAREGLTVSWHDQRSPFIPG